MKIQIKKIIKIFIFTQKYKLFINQLLKISEKYFFLKVKNYILLISFFYLFKIHLNKKI